MILMIKQSHPMLDQIKVYWNFFIFLMNLSFSRNKFQILNFALKFEDAKDVKSSKDAYFESIVEPWPYSFDCDRRH